MLEEFVKDNSGEFTNQQADETGNNYGTPDEAEMSLHFIDCIVQGEH